MENFVYSDKEELEQMEIMDNYNSSIAKYIKSHLKTKDMQILDFGSGIGTIAKYFPKDRLTCLEIDSQQRKIISDKGFKTIASLDEVDDDSLDFVYSSNVLEHIEDDFQAIKNIVKKMHNGAKIAFYVSAFPILYSKMDERVGHFRRYTKKRLLEVFEKAELSVEEIFFSDSLGFFTTLLFKFLGNKDGTTSTSILKIYDKIIYPLSNFLDKVGCRWFVGKNLFIAAKKIKI
jgi:hypothetical protein